jgi:hypothetical protein
MNGLPIEIKVDIFSRLDFKDKLQCALTCRDWHSRISSTVLYAKIGVNYPQWDDRTIAKLKHLYYEDLRYQVLDLYMREIDDPLELSELFPNLKLLRIGKWVSDHWEDTHNVDLARKWKKLEVINEGCSSRNLVTMKLLDVHMVMASLLSLTIDLCSQSIEILPLFFKQVKHAPALEHLSLKWATGLNCKKLDLLHENTPNLKHLELNRTDPLFVEISTDVEEYQPLSMDWTVASNMRSFSINFSKKNSLLRSYREMNSVYWIEYICRKYTNLTRVKLQGLYILESQYIKNVMTDHLQRAFYNWSQLKMFYMRPIYFTTNLIQAMDNCNICLKQVNLYIYGKDDTKQLVDLADSKQRNITELTINVQTDSWTEIRHLLYFFYKIEKDRQLKSIDIWVNKKYPDSNYCNEFIPNLILEYVPYLKRLTMSWIGTRKLTAFNQTTHLTHIDLKLCQLNHDLQWQQATQQHIQAILYASPLLQSFAIDFQCKVHDFTLDFQQNIKLKCFKYLPRYEYVFRIIRDNRMKWYSHCLSDENLAKIVRIKPEDAKNVNIILFVPLILRNTFFQNVE